MDNVLETQTMFKNQMNMNRQQRKWINKLTNDQIHIIDKMVADKAGAIAGNYIKSYIGNFRVAAVSALILMLGDSLNSNDIKEILALADILNQESNYIYEFGVNWVKEVNELKELAEEKMLELYDSGIHAQNIIIKELRKNTEFKKLAQKDLVELFKGVKDRKSGIEIKSMEDVEKEIEAAAEYILNDEKFNDKQGFRSSKHVQKELMNELEYVQKLDNEQKRVVIIDDVQKQKMNTGGEKKDMKKSAELKKDFVEFATEQEALDKERKQLELDLEKIRKESVLVDEKKDKLNQAIEILESIGM